MKKILVLFAIVLGLTGHSTQDAVEEHKEGRRIVCNN